MTRKTEKKVAPKGAVEIKEEELDQASGGAVDAFRTAVQQDFHMEALTCRKAGGTQETF